jgi:hypothetical protein
LPANRLTKTSCLPGFLRVCLSDYPRLTHDDILACIAYAAETIKNERIYPLAI